LFNGFCRNSTTPCDLFLLSWTLTPTGGSEAAEPAVQLSRAANKELVNKVTMTSAAPRTAAGRTITVNLIYTDVAEKSRSVDVAFLRNRLAT
jgi:hypothetical protein